MLRRARPLLIAFALALVLATVASAGWGGSDPTHNYPLGVMPPACFSAPTGKTCIDAGVYYLDKARASLGLPAFKLPADFPSLTPPEQTFILTNLDRVRYGLPPVPGLTAALNNDALTRGVLAQADPSPSNQNELNTWTANWAGGFYNAPMAYEGWVYDDGLGSGNRDCTPANTAGCWGHRHDVLWKFALNDVLAMGAAAGDGPSGRAYAMLIVGGNPARTGDPGYTPTYSYTWTQAVADGAGTHTYDPGTPVTSYCVVPPVISFKLARAKRAITKAHCRVGRVVKKHTAYVPGVVIRQSPAPGKTLPRGAKVKLVLSLGPRRR